MTPGASEQEQRLGIASALERSQLTLDEVWLRYFALGGNAGLVELEAFLTGLMPLPTGQRDMLAHAVNERLSDFAAPARAPYSRVVRQRMPRDGPLAALVGLLDGVRLAPPEDLPALVAAAGRAVGTEIVVYLVDDAQQTLTPMPHTAAGERERLDVDSTSAGRAFRHIEVLPSTADGQLRLWVPLLDGAERLGVLDVLVEHAVDLYDPVLRQQLSWVAGQLGHLVGEYGDSLHAGRLSRPRSPAAELVRSLLPPLAAGTPTFSVAGLVEPSAEGGADAFDYVLGTSTVLLAIFDGMGHGLAAGLVAAAALAASRTARRDGRGLHDRARAVDDVIGEQFGEGLLTGVLAELDLSSGRLRYLAAGHPHPLLLRGGHVVRTLTGGRRTPFGLPSHENTVGEEQLEPGDWLLLHTDGVTEACDADGEFFGERRLVDFLEREAGAGHPPAETVRRLMHAVLTHQNGILQDDATVLLARWDASDLPGNGLADISGLTVVPR